MHIQHRRPQASAEYEFRGPLSAPLSHAHRGLRRLGFFWTTPCIFWKTTPSRPSVPRLSGPCKPVLLGVL
jgi:hypothetical protein